MSFKSLTLRRASRDGFASAMMHLLALSALVFFLFTSFAHAQEKRVLTSAILSDVSGGLTLAPYTLLMKDPTNKISPESIRASGGSNLSGSMIEGRMIHLGFDGTPVWLTIKLKGNSINDSWILDLGRRSDGRVGYLQSLKVYEAMIDATGISLKEIPQNAGIYNIRLVQSAEKLILVSTKPAAGRPSTLPLKIFSEKSYLQHLQKRSAINGFFCAVFAGFALYFLAYAVSHKRKSYTLYTLHFLLILTAWVFYNGPVSNSGSNFLSLIIPICLLLFLIISTLLTRIFWNIGEQHYTERNMLNGIIGLNIAVFILGVILPINSGITHALLYYGAPVITLALIALMSLAQSAAQRKNKLFFYAWLPPIIGLLLTVCGSFGVTTHNLTIMMNAFWYMFLPHGIIMAVAIFYNKQDSVANAHSPVSDNDSLTLDRIKQTKDTADHSRLLKVIEKEREMLAEFRAKEEVRMDEMQRAKEEADEANRAKSAFLAVVSHEIRTPMTGVMGMVRLLMDSSLTKQQRDYAMTIQESSEAMLGLLNDILDFEKIQRGKVDLENISFDLHRLIQGVITLMSGHAAQKNIGLSARMNDDLPRFVKGDPTRLRQILLNLMGNGIKFTSTGSVTLMVKLMAQSEGENPEKRSSHKHMIYFAVQDTGIGIPAEAQKNLFNPFSQANSTITRKFGGTGLGLAISKGLLESMGSNININSREGEGSTFFFTLEMEPGIASSQEQTKSPVEEEQQPTQPLKILVVDDNAITTMVVIGFLRDGKHEIVTCSSAEDALQKIKADAFDMVLMDIELPGMPGNEATKILREHPDPVKAKIPVIAMTGNVEKEYLQRYMTDGMNGFLTKPIDIDKLKSVVNEISRKTYEREIKAPGVPAAGYVPAPPPAPIIPEQKSMLSIEGVFNPEMLQSLKEAIGGTQLNDLLNDLIVKTDEILQAMIDASKDGDLKTLAARAHELKGMAGNFGLTEISSIAEQTEKKAKAHETDGIAGLVATLPDANERAQNALKQWVSD